MEKAEEVARLKEKLDAIIVAHNYQRPEVQDVADFTGDSLELARKCAEIKAGVIVFCGVRFMAETAAILNPDSTVLLSHPDAGCPLADMITIEKLRQRKKEHPEAAIVTYVNSTAEIKAESDVCCTSANGINIVNAMPNEEILFVPDRNLGHYISSKTDKKMILYPGFCSVHADVTAEDVKLAKQHHPRAKVLVHPECTAEVINLADAALSTSQMLRYVKHSEDRTFLIGTEEGMLYPLGKQNPEKEFYLLSDKLVCLDMKKTTLETLIEAMKTGRNVVTVPEEIRVKARHSIERMLSIT